MYHHMKMIWTLGGIIFLLPFAIATAQAQASTASDDASNTTYSGGWINGSNGGSGFLPWTLSSGSHAGFFLGNSNGNGSGAGPGINTSGTSFGLYANSGDTAAATRPFNGTLSVGQTFMMDFDNGFVDNGGKVGFSLTDSSANARFVFSFSAGDSAYRVQDNAGTTALANVSGTLGFTEAGLHTELMLTSSTTYSFKVVSLSNNNTFTQSGTLIGAVGGIDRVTAFNNYAGAGSTNDAFVNNLKVAPAATPGLPAPLVVAMGIPFLTVYLRRRNAPAKL